MKNGWRRIVSTAVAIFLANGTAFVCAPIPAAAEEHCKPAQMAKAGCSDCRPQQNVMDCCATSAPQPASVPQDTQQQGTRASASAMAAQLDAVVVLAALQPPDVARRLRAAPPHGYRSTDLPTLHAVFLI